MTAVEDSPATGPLRVGVLGAGVIATADYGVLPNMRHIAGKASVTAIADTVPGRAQAVAERFGIPQAFGSLADMLADADIDAVANLTPIPVHAELSLQILASGRHLVTEKPLATTMADADEIAAAARSAGVLVVCSPPNMIYPSRQEARRLVAAGAIGQVALAKVRASHAGPAAMGWPLDPTWFYQDGSGPLFDIGVYGLDELTGILGPARRVTAFSGITERQRRAVGGAFDGLLIDVTADDNTVMLLDFGDSCFGLADGTFNMHATRAPRLEVFGREGTLVMHYNTNETGPNPPVELYQAATPGPEGRRGGWAELDLSHLDRGQQHVGRVRRAVLIEHLADCLREGREPELSLARARHVLEIMIKAMDSARTGEAVELETSFAAAPA
jgi:predicted dehydrogenase